MSNKNTIMSTKEKKIVKLEHNMPSVSSEEIIGDKKKTMRCKKLKNINDNKPLSRSDKLADAVISSGPDDNDNDNDKDVMIIHQRDLALSKTELQHPVSDNTIDELETRVDKFNKMTHLGKKIKLHNALKDSFQALEQEVDEMVDIIDKIDIDAVSNDIKQSLEDRDSARTDITDDIVNIEKMVDDMKEEDVMQIKLMYIQKITDAIKKCKSICDSNKMRIAKCN